MRSPLDKKKAMKRFIVGQSIGGGIGGLLGLVPGIVASVVPFLNVSVGYSAEGLVCYFGLLIGAGSGAIVGSIITATQLVTEAILVAEEGAIDDAAGIGMPGRK